MRTAGGIASPFEATGNGIGRMTTDGKVTIYPYAIPSFTGTLATVSLASGPDDDLWFTDSTYGDLFSITRQGRYEPPLAVDASPDGLVEGSGKDLWFADATTNTTDVYTFR